MDAGHELLVLDDLSTGSRENIFTNQKSYTHVEADYISQSGLKALLDFRPKAVFHLAALKAAGESMEEPEKYCKNNIRKSFQLIEELSKSACRYFIFSSSAAVYGTPRYLPLDEKHPLEPINYYGFTKRMIEENLLWFSRLGKMRCAILRYFNAAGYDSKGRICGIEKTPNNLIPVIMETVIGIRKNLIIFGKDYNTPDGTCIRDYIHISDLSHAHFLAMQHIIKTDQDIILNLGAEQGCSVAEVVQASENVCSKKIPCSYGERRSGDADQLVSSSQLAYKTLGWNAKHSQLENILKSTWQVYEKYFSLEKT